MKLNKYLFLIAALLFFFSCKDEDLGPIVTFDSGIKGAYPRLLAQTDKLINLFDIAGSQYTYTLELVDLEKGKLVTDYVVDMVYKDNDPSNGNNSVGPVEFLRFTTNDFKTNAAGYQEVPTITIRATEAMAAAGVTAEQLSPGDEFNFIGRVILQDGSVYSQANSSAAIYGSAFRGHFNFTLPVGCPSNLTGTYAYETTEIWCGGDAVTGTVNILAQGGGVYKFSDWAFGAYGPCYGGGIATGDLTFREVCAVVSFTGFTDSFGDTWTFTSAIEGEKWIIKWVNTYGEAATSVIIHPSGEWPITLK